MSKPINTTLIRDDLQRIAHNMASTSLSEWKEAIAQQNRSMGWSTVAETTAPSNIAKIINRALLEGLK